MSVHMCSSKVELNQLPPNTLATSKREQASVFPPGGIQPGRGFIQDGPSHVSQVIGADNVGIAARQDNTYGKSGAKSNRFELAVMYAQGCATGTLLFCKHWA